MAKCAICWSNCQLDPGLGDCPAPPASRYSLRLEPHAVREYRDAGGASYESILLDSGYSQRVAVPVSRYTCILIAMFSLPSHYQGSRRLALCVAMMGVLFLCAIQVVEASHLHAPSDVSTQCILSGAFTDTAVSTVFANIAFYATTVSPSAPRILPCIVRTTALPPSRGPPLHLLS